LTGYSENAYLYDQKPLVVTWDLQVSNPHFNLTYSIWHPLWLTSPATEHQSKVTEVYNPGLGEPLSCTVWLQH